MFKQYEVLEVFADKYGDVEDVDHIDVIQVDEESDSFYDLVTQELENNDALELEKGVQLFEKGMALAKICKSKLSIMENKIINIKTKYANNNEKD